MAKLNILTEQLAPHDDGVFVLYVVISQKTVGEFMSASLTAGKEL